MKRAVLGTCIAFACLMLASPAWAGTLIDQAVAGLKTNPVYVDPSAQLKLTGSEVSSITSLIRSGNTPIVIAVLPSAAADEVGGPDSVPPAIGRALGKVTVGSVAGKSFRAGSAVLPQGRAASLATLAFNGHHTAGLAPVLIDFVKRVQSETAISTANSGPSGSQAQGQPAAQPAPDASHTSGWVWVALVVALLLIIGIAAVVIYLWRSKHRLDEEREEEEQRRRWAAMQEPVAETPRRARKARKTSQTTEPTEDSGASARVPQDHAEARYYGGGYYGGMYYGPGYYPNQFLQGMLWAHILDDDDDRGHHDHDHGDSGSSSSSSKSSTDWSPPAAPSGDWDSSSDKGSSGGGGDFGSSDDVSEPAYSPPSYDPPSMPDFGGGGGGDFGGGGGSGGGGDF